MTFGFAFSKRAWTERRKQRRRTSRLTNLKIVEVSSVDNGAGMDCTIRLLKREGNIMEKRTQSHEPFALSKPDAARAKRLVDAIDFERLNKAHSSGKISSAEYSEVLRGMANTAYPGDKQALAKFLKANSAVMAAKLAHDYSALHAQIAGQQATGVGNGLGLQRLNQNGVLSDGVNSPNAVGNQPVQSGNEVYAKFAHPRDTAVTVENVAKLARDHFGGDVVKAATALRRAGEEKFGSAT